MGFERQDVTDTMILYRTLNGKIKYSGLVRQTDTNGDSTLRISNGNIQSIEFDDIEIVPSPIWGQDTELSLTLFDGDWSVELSS